MTASEHGLTIGVPSGVIEIYDFVAGMAFVTIPTSGFGWAGSFTKDDTDKYAEFLKSGGN